MFRRAARPGVVGVDPPGCACDAAHPQSKEEHPMTRLAFPALALLLTHPLTGAAQVRPDLDRGLVAAYPLDGEAVDAVTRARAAAVATRPAEDRNGVRGAAHALDREPRGGAPARPLHDRRVDPPAGGGPRAGDRVQDPQPPRPLPEEPRA